MKRFYQIFLVAIFIGVAVLFLKGYFYQEEIYENGAKTICKYKYCKKFPKTTEAYFEYYVNGELYKNSYGQCPNSDCLENKFFILKYSKKDPQKITVDFSKEITDSIEISKAGFELNY